jgi:hypothetical protein
LWVITCSKSGTAEGLLFHPIWPISGGARKGWFGACSMPEARVGVEVAPVDPTHFGRRRINRLTERHERTWQG